MLALQKRITAAIAAVVLYGSMLMPSAQALTTGISQNAANDAIAMITAKSGTVFKRDFVDWEKEVWGDAAPASVNDKLHEGMQIGTGNNSWAEVSWPNVKTRAWSNTVFAVAPNKRLVYLTGGEMLFRLDKHRKDKDQAYFIWTKVLQARIRGTTVLVQAKGSVTRFTVLEGTVEILNRLDRSRVTLKPGVVYEIVGYDTPNATSKTYKPTAMVTPKKFDGSITDITYERSSDKGKNPIFQDKFSSSNVYVANSEALKNHPLVQVAGGQIDSMPLIEAEQKDLPGVNQILGIPLADNARLDKVVANGLKLEAVPKSADYFVGQTVNKIVHLPQGAQDFLPPKGVILNQQTLQVAKMTPMTPPPAVPFMLGAPVQNPAADTAEVKTDKDAAAAVFNHHETPAGEDIVQEQTQEFGQSAMAPALVPATCLTPVENPAQEAFQALPGATPNYMSNSTIVPTGIVPNVGATGQLLTTTSALSAAAAAGTVRTTTAVPSMVAPTAGSLLNNVLPTNNLTNSLNLH